MFKGEKKKLTKLVKKRKFKSIEPWIGVSNSCLFTKDQNMQQYRHIDIYIYIYKCDASAENKYHNVNSVALILCFFLCT